MCVWKRERGEAKGEGYDEDEINTWGSISWALSSDRINAPPTVPLPHSVPVAGRENKISNSLQDAASNVSFPSSTAALCLTTPDSF